MSSNLPKCLVSEHQTAPSQKQVRNNRLADIDDRQRESSLDSRNTRRHSGHTTVGDEESVASPWTISSSSVQTPSPSSTSPSQGYPFPSMQSITTALTSSTAILQQKAVQAGQLYRRGRDAVHTAGSLTRQGPGAGVGAGATDTEYDSDNDEAASVHSVNSGAGCPTRVGSGFSELGLGEASVLGCLVFRDDEDPTEEKGRKEVKRVDSGTSETLLKRTLSDIVPPRRDGK